MSDAEPRHQLGLLTDDQVASAMRGMRVYVAALRSLETMHGSWIDPNLALEIERAARVHARLQGHTNGLCDCTAPREGVHGNTVVDGRMGIQ